MVEVEIDGRTVSVAEGSMVMHAANQAGVYVPHFCYHKKLSIAANCRMCLVEVEKAPKAMPACATPVTAGMKVHTHSRKAVDAQKAVMEFLLINHPLDCPICDQGGECQLQDLAVGYGASHSNYREEKRVVFHKNIGPLVSAEEMSRCIQCTRCVRFGQEIAGVMELGMAGRGEHSQILTFLGRSVDSELSGNMIDLCPVGALTSKPFRYQARTWELVRRRSVSPHDSLGANLVVQVKQDMVKRVLPFENEAVNECWLSDRDRFSYLGLHASDRLLVPMIKQDNEWHEVSWESALDYVTHALSDVCQRHGGDALAMLASPTSTLEELYLGGALMRGLGSENIDFRLRQIDFALDPLRTGAPWLGHTLEEVGQLDALLIVGSFLRKDHPLLSARVRAAARQGTAVSSLHGVAEDWLMPMQVQQLAAPSQWLDHLIEVLVACAHKREVPLPEDYAVIRPSAAAAELADALMIGEQRAIWLGNAVVQHPDYSAITQVVQALASLTEARFGVIGESASSVGGYLAAAFPAVGSKGLDAAGMIAHPRKAYLLHGIEPSLDLADPLAARAALKQAATVIATTAYASPELMEVADCLLPITPFTEMGGSFVNTEGRLQTFNGVVRPAGQARPGWKVLRVLGTLAGIPGFGFESVEEVRARALAEVLEPGAVPVQAVVPREASARPGAALRRSVRVQAPADGRHFGRYLSNRCDLQLPAYRGQKAVDGLQRLSHVPIYAVDALVRRSAPLQKTADARQVAVLRLHGETIARLGLEGVETVRVRQGAGEAVLPLVRDDRLAREVAWLPAAHEAVANLPGLYGTIVVEAVK
ncbi:MAG: NADH-quinone oxidoreductase subunit NuoG [Lautropia sp.]|nr:NADH-quinone oxidoreductase subunit NuoG [Lautropia sp.]